VQVAPLREKLAGGASLLVQVPWKPTDVLAPGAIVPLYEALVIDTFSPDWLTDPSF